MTQANGQPLILEGCTVLDFTQYLAGPGVTRMMAELGADIIKVELPDVGDGGRLVPFDGNGRSGFFVQHNRGKRSVCVDWSTEEGRRLLLDLARDVDIVVENFSAAEIMARRGLDYESIRAVNPKVIYLSVSCFGRNSAWAGKPGYDYIAQAVSGIMHMTGEPDGPPTFVGSALGDTNGAVHGFAAVGYALYHRERTGVGQHLDISMTDALFHFHEFQLMGHHLTGGTFEPKRYGRHHVAVFPAGTFQGPQGYIVVLALDLQWANVCRCIGREDLEHDPRYDTLAKRAERRFELIPLIESWMATFDSDQDVLDELERHHVPAGPVLSPLDAIDHPYFKSRDMVRWVDDPVTGPIPIPGFPFKFSAQPELPPLMCPGLGEHTDEVLAERLGFTDAHIERLHRDGVLHTAAALPGPAEQVSSAEAVTSADPGSIPAPPEVAGPAEAAPA